MRPISFTPGQSIAVASIVVVGLGLSGCGHQTRELTVLRGATMGTTYTVTHAATDGSGAAEQQAIDSLLEAVNLSMSTYIDTSTISLINSSSDTTSWHTVDAHFAAVFSGARRIHAETGGAFNPAVGPLINAWGFGPHGQTATPDSAAIDSLLGLIDLDSFVLQGTPWRLKKRLPNASLDFGAIAKGYGVDVVGRFLESGGIHDYFVEIGGEVRTRGRHPDGREWRVGIEQPVVDDGLEPIAPRVVHLGDAAMATSGNYRNFYDREGQRYAHILNPATGRPEVTSLMSVSVLAQDCMTADAYATAFMVMGVHEAKDFLLKQAESQNSLRVLFVSSLPSGQIEEEQWPPGTIQ